MESKNTYAALRGLLIAPCSSGQAPFLEVSSTILEKKACRLQRVLFFGGFKWEIWLPFLFRGGGRGPAQKTCWFDRQGMRLGMTSLKHPLCTPSVPTPKHIRREKLFGDQCPLLGLNTEQMQAPKLAQTSLCIHGLIYIYICILNMFLCIYAYVSKLM